MQFFAMLISIVLSECSPTFRPRPIWAVAGVWPVSWLALHRVRGCLPRNLKVPVAC